MKMIVNIRLIILCAVFLSLYFTPLQSFSHNQNQSPQKTISSFPSVPSSPIDFAVGERKSTYTSTIVSESKNELNSPILVQKGGKEKVEAVLKKEYIAEFIGTLLLVVFGCGSNCSAIYNGAFSGVWQIASAWGLAVTIAVYCTASVSGAHINPAVSFANALQSKKTGFSWKDFKGYVIAQMLGAFTGGLANLAVFSSFIRQFEKDNGIVRGAAASFQSAKAFGEYPHSLLPVPKALLVEVWATLILMFSIKGITDPNSTALVKKDLAPLLIGFVVCILICLFGPLTQCCMNPARDFGPRLVTLLAGWGKVAIPGPRNSFWIYIIGPLIGAPLGAYIYDKLISSQNKLD